MLFAPTEPKGVNISKVSSNEQTLSCHPLRFPRYRGTGILKGDDKKSSSSPTGDQAPLGAEGGQKRISPFALPPRGEKEDLEGLPAKFNSLCKAHNSPAQGDNY